MSEETFQVLVVLGNRSVSVVDECHHSLSVDVTFSMRELFAESLLTIAIASIEQTVA